MSFRVVALLGLLVVAVGAVHDAAVAQTPPNAGAPKTAEASASLMDRIADVVIFVTPTSPDTARIGVSYNTRVKHDSVKADIGNLLSATGWNYGGDLFVNDASVHPERPKEFPVTTGAQLTVTRAPQIVHSAPELLPYLQAFHAFSHVEVNFALPDLQPYNGVEHFVSKALSVELHKDQGVYRYETEIRDHQNRLPDLVPSATIAAGADPVNGHDGPAKSVPSRFGRAAGTMVVLGGILVVAGIGIYILMARRDTKTVPVRSTLRR